jgi:hypothetical protein
MRTKGLGVSLLIAALVLAGLPAQGIGLVSHEDHARGSTVYHGIAHDDTEDDWRSWCLPVTVDHTLTLAVPSELDETHLDARLAIHADHAGGDADAQTVTAVAEPGEPATVEVTSPCGSPQFSVEALFVDAATNYTVECTSGCYDGPP